MKIKLYFLVFFLGACSLQDSSVKIEEFDTDPTPSPELVLNEKAFCFISIRVAYDRVHFGESFKIDEEKCKKYLKDYDEAEPERRRQINEVLNNRTK